MNEFVSKIEQNPHVVSVNLGYFDPIAREQFIIGDHRYAKYLRQENVVRIPGSIPGGVLIREMSSKTEVHRIFRGPDWTADVESLFNHTAVGVWVSATTPEVCDVIIDQVFSQAGVKPTEQGIVDMRFWFATSTGPTYTTNTINVPGWEDIKMNYASGAREAFNTLMSAKPEVDGGRLLLFHGPPGTGKTTAIRSIAREWREWCHVETIIDPDRLFNDASYLTTVMLQSRGTGWRLLVLEDCDELIRGDAKARTGQTLARLLNMSDGLLGQGQKLLIALTTNEPLDRLHPAIVRPGRCLAQIEVGQLSAEEATSWLGEPVSKPTTLAELYARQSDSGPTTSLIEPESVPSGQYL